MRNIPYIQPKTTRLRTNLYTINKNGLQTNTSKIDGITFRGGARTQKGLGRQVGSYISP